MNLLLDHICLFISNKKELIKVLLKMQRYLVTLKIIVRLLIPNLILVNIEDYVSDSVNKKHNGIKNIKMYLMILF